MTTILVLGGRERRLGRFRVERIVREVRIDAGHLVEDLAGRGFDVPVSVLDISLARAELDWTPRISLKDGLRLTLAAQDQ